MEKSSLYTRTGDLGTTSLVGGQRVSKSSARLEAYGTVDELNTWLGVLVSKTSMPEDQARLIVYLQHRLFDLGAYLATPVTEGNPQPQIPALGQSAVSKLEHAIDMLDNDTPALTQFVLPGGTALSALTGVARTVCRRAERRIIELSQQEYVDDSAIRFVNRLSDYLFALSRYLNYKAGEPEVYWSKEI